MNGYWKRKHFDYKNVIVFNFITFCIFKDFFSVTIEKEKYNSTQPKNMYVNFDKSQILQIFLLLLFP